MAERAGGGGEFVCRREGRALDDWQKGKGEGTRCSAAMRPERRMRWKGERPVLQPRQVQPRIRTKRNINSTRQEYCYDLRRTTFATTATAFDCTRWVVVVVPPPRALLAPPTFPSASHFSHTLLIYLPFPVSPLPLPFLLTRHATPTKPHRYRLLPPVPPAP